MPTDWNAAGDAELAGATALRRAIHADPEIGLRCPRTATRLKAALANLPLEIHEGPSTTGFVAILRGPHNGRTVLLRGDMDALPIAEQTGLPFASGTPGLMHACGHDTHSAMLAGAARALCARRDELAGTVAFMFQPGEEGHHGARHMIADGLLDHEPADAAFALHILPNAPAGQVVTRPGPIMASTDTVRVAVVGRGGHAAMPHECIDPVPVACEIVSALQSFVARRVPVGNPAVLSVTKIEAGTAHNIIPDRVDLLGTLRTLSPATRQLARDAVARIATHVAQAHGCVATAELEPGYPVTVNDPRAVALVRACATDLGRPHATMPQPMMGAEDFSYVLERVPGAMTFLGTAAPGTDPATAPPLHNSRMIPHEAAMAQGIALHCATAARFLERGWG